MRHATYVNANSHEHTRTVTTRHGNGPANARRTGTRGSGSGELLEFSTCSRTVGVVHATARETRVTSVTADRSIGPAASDRPSRIRPRARRRGSGPRDRASCGPPSRTSLLTRPVTGRTKIHHPARPRGSPHAGLSLNISLTGSRVTRQRDREHAHRLRHASACVGSHRGHANLARGRRNPCRCLLVSA